MRVDSLGIQGVCVFVGRRSSRRSAGDIKRKVEHSIRAAQKKISAGQKKICAGQILFCARQFERFPRGV
jgi:hypothetical protein